MNDRPTPETDAFFRTFVHGQAAPSHAEYYDRMRCLERERDEAREELGRIKMHVHSLVSNLESHPCACDWLDETISQLLQ